MTYWTSKENYGQLLQCFALQQFLKKMGHSPFLIKYSPKPIIRKRSIFQKFVSYIFHFPAYIRYSKQLFIQRRNRKYIDNTSNIKRQFDSFLENFIDSTERSYTQNDLFETPPKADAYICGSDQIWGGDEMFYLPFVPKEKKIIAYAPSFGGVNSFSDEYELRLKKYLARFDFLGIREQSGVDLCRNLGFLNAIKVVDPTLLLSSNDYDSIRIETYHDKPYIFLYLLGNPCACKVKEVYNFATQNNLDVIYVASQNQNDKYEKISPQIGEWLDYLAKSEFVITNSFHCTVFSLIYKKKFMTIPLVGAFQRMNTRIEELLSHSDLNQAIYNGDIESVYKESFDFSNFYFYKDQEREKSYSYFKSNLK